VHYFKYGRNFRFKGEKHDFWEMVFIDSGNAKIIAGEKELTLKQGEVYFHKPNELHNIYTDDKFANSAIITFECKGRVLKQLADKIHVLDEYEKSLLNKIIQEAKISYCDKLNDVYLIKMSKNSTAPIGGEQIIKNCIELLIIFRLRSHDCKIKNNDNLSLNISSNKIVDSVKAILYEKLDSAASINLNDISYKLGFSKSYIKSQFKKQTNSSIIQYYIDLKIDKAKKLLSQQKFTVSEIADALGFSSVYYFSRQFKLHTDMSPTEYINSIKADNVL
jgi:AraC-like DNA-binding protein